MELGPELFQLLNRKQRVGDRTPVVYGDRGLSLQNLRDPGRVLFPWSEFEKRRYDERIEWILRGAEFDIERNGLWLERWGKKPDTLSVALDIARRDFATWPKLLPIYGHRFLAAQFRRDGNPIFSIMQTDIIYYGADLPHYLLNEFVDQDWALHTRAQKIQKIEVWSDFAEGLI
jgi:hypothetical protein